MPSSASRTTASGALMSFFMVCVVMAGSREEELEGQRAERSADQRADHGNPGVAPVRRALAGDRQEGVGDARPEVTRGVDRVAGRAAEREADREDQEAGDQRAQAAGLQALVDAEREQAEDQQEGPDDLGDEVRGGVADRGGGREDGELE